MPTNPVQCLIRPFAEADREELRRLYLETRRQAFHWMNTAEFQASEFDAAIADELVLVAVVEGMAVGFVSLWLADNFVHNLFVHPGWQGRGIGSLLLEASRPHLIDPVSLKCLVRNTRARAFYESHGWTVTSRGSGPDGGYLNMVWSAQSAG